MKCSELIAELKSFAALPVNEEKTCDTVKAGNPERELSKVAVTMFATPEVVRVAVEWGAEMLIVHEPVFYNHMDRPYDHPLEKKKREFIADSGLTVFRFHDYAHTMEPDLIFEGNIKYLGLKGTYSKSEFLAVNRFVLDEDITALELADLIEKKLGLRHVRIAGSPQTKGRRISCCFGTPGHLDEELRDNDFVLAGEICEWQIGEMARDYSMLGEDRAVLVMGHIGSERAGMMLLEEKLTALHGEFETKYFECGEVYQYTD